LAIGRKHRNFGKYGRPRFWLCPELPFFLRTQKTPRRRKKDFPGPIAVNDAERDFIEENTFDRLHIFGYRAHIFGIDYW
jgi:hypothetical protein